jgi:MarR family transcriptional regulator, lower aerobic nicotinate degradation pathway regulator
MKSSSKILISMLMIGMLTGYRIRTIPKLSATLDQLPGHGIRRLQQIAVALFLQETEVHDITPVQYAALHTVANEAGIDQRSLALAIGLDTSTLAGVIDRLAARGLIERAVSAHDRRMHALAATAAGKRLLAAVEPGMQRAQQRILAPLRNKAERVEFMRMLSVLVESNNDASRAPSQTLVARRSTVKPRTPPSGAAPAVGAATRRRVGTGPRSGQVR